MKNMKKLVALLLAAIMCLGLVTVASAVDSYTITVANAVEGKTYTAYKIFSGTDTGKGYILDSTSAAYDLLVTNDNVQTSYALEQTAITGKYNVTVSDAPALAEWLKSQTLTSNGVSAINGVITLTEAGYYFVTTNSGTLANLDSVTGDITIYDKNVEPDIEKTTTASADVEIGQTIPYTITGEVPSTTGYDKYEYIITDTLSKGLTLNDAKTLTIGGASVALTADNCKVTNNEDGTTELVVTLDMTKYSVGAKIELTYSATVNADAVTVDGLTNKATLTYSNDPNDDTQTDTNTDHVVKNYTAVITIDKVDGNTDAKLANAKFVLYKEETDEDGNTVKKFYAYDEETAKVEWVDTQVDATVYTTDDQGSAKFIGLANGTYQLLETEAPAGYNLMTAATEVEVEANENKTTVRHTETIENNAGTNLPATGGIGTTIFYIVGGLLVVGAGVLLITKKRMSHNG